MNTVGYVVCCPKCGKIHSFNERYVDEIVNCECEFEFYAFAMGTLHIVMSADEARYDPIVRSMRRFVISTGRCGDIPPELYVDHDGQERYDMTAQELDAEEELSRVLDDYQTDSYGECLVTKELLDTICENLYNGKDIELKKKKDGVDVIELKKKHVSTKKPENRRLYEYTQLSVDSLRSGGLFRINP